MLKEPKAGEYWIDRDHNDYIVLIIGLDSDGDPVFEEKYGRFNSYRSEAFHSKFKYEPDCDGFNWVKPVPVPVESPDDFVVQDRVPARIGIDKGWWSAANVTPAPSAHWFNVNSNHTGMMHRHQCKDRTALNLCCRRADLPPLESPDDWVTQGVVEDRPGIDQWRWIWSTSQSEWCNTIEGTSFFKHGYKNKFGDKFEVRCRRKDLPKPAEPTNQDYVTQDVAPIRVGVDEFRYLKMNFRMSDTYDNFRGHEHHGWIHPDTGEALELRCLRSQLPVPEPKKTRVELRLCVNKFTGEIVHDRGMNTMDDWHEVLFDTTGQPYYLKD